MTKLCKEYLRCEVNDLRSFDKEPKELTIVISEKKYKKDKSFKRIR